MNVYGLNSWMKTLIHTVVLLLGCWYANGGEFSRCKWQVDNENAIPKLLPAPKYGVCVDASAAPFHSSRLENKIEIYMPEKYEYVPAPLRMRIGRLFSAEVPLSPRHMELENDLTAFILLVKAPGISSAEAMTTSLEGLQYVIDELQLSFLHGSSSYTLVINAEALYIAAGSISGVDAALSSIEYYQTHRKSHYVYSEGFLPILVIPFDEPRFQWRGWHLDVSRHLFSVDVLLRAIDKIAALKYNTFHLHLTDDQGWRFQVPELPLLVQVGSHRLGENDGSLVSGFYSDKDIETVVNYCMEKGIRVIPEIDFPGHAGSILASYPNLACSHSQTPPGGRVPGEFGELPYSLCLHDDSSTQRSITFAEKVLTRVAHLFPNSKFIHLGGDEVPHDVPGRNIVKFFSSIFSFLENDLGGLKAVVWDEVLAVFKRFEDVQTLIEYDVIVQAWQGSSAVRRSLVAGLKTIASPMEVAYLNYKNTPYEVMRSYDPLQISCTSIEDADIEGSVDQRLLLGAGACLWTEYVLNESALNALAFPRSEALANAFWSHRDGTRNASNFCGYTSLKTHLEYGDEYFGIHMLSDGDEGTIFWSEGAPEAGDHVSLRIFEPTELSCGINVITGKNGRDRCKRCRVSIQNGSDPRFQHVGFVDEVGILRVQIPPSHINSIRLEVLESQRSWLMVREMQALPCRNRTPSDEH